MAHIGAFMVTLAMLLRFINYRFIVGLHAIIMIIIMTILLVHVYMYTCTQRLCF